MELLVNHRKRLSSHPPATTVPLSISTRDQCHLRDPLTLWSNNTPRNHCGSDCMVSLGWMAGLPATTNVTWIAVPEILSLSIESRAFTLSNRRDAFEWETVTAGDVQC